MAKSELKFNELIKKVENDIEQIKAAIVQRASDEIKSTFQESNVNIEPAPSGANISVNNEDHEFLKKEFGADKYKPANKSIRIKRGIGKKIKRWMGQ